MHKLVCQDTLRLEHPNQEGGFAQDVPTLSLCFLIRKNWFSLFRGTSVTTEDKMVIFPKFNQFWRNKWDFLVEDQNLLN